MKLYGDKQDALAQMSHPARGAWIEIGDGRLQPALQLSHPARGAWIEIPPTLRSASRSLVAPRKGCVD